MARRPRECPNCKRLEKDVALLRDMVTRLVEQNEALQRRIHDLEERLNQDSTNSSKPPSTDPPEKKRQRTTKPKSKRKRGAQPGHANQQRKLRPEDQVDKIVACVPESCERCTGQLRGTDPNPRRTQTVEIPPPEPMITEFQQHALECEACGHTTVGALPADARAFGPRVQAIVSLLSGAYRLSKREIERMMRDVFDVEMSLGTVCNLQHATSEALAAPMAEAEQFVRAQLAVHLDETGWREAKRRAWLWTAVTASVIVFAIRFSRGSKVAKELIGPDYRGITHSDRWSAYSWIDPRRRQLCWSHLLRDFQKLIDRGGIAAAIGRRLKKRAEEMFRYWHRVLDGTLQRSTFQAYLSPIRQDMLAVLEAGTLCRNTKTAEFCKNVLKLQSALWVFARVEGVDPTNNAAERAVRKPVLWRKGSFGTDSAKGSRFVERILSTVATLRAQQRNVLEYLVEACAAARRGQLAPSLLPNSTQTA